MMPSPGRRSEKRRRQSKPRPLHHDGALTTAAAAFVFQVRRRPIVVQGRGLLAGVVFTSRVQAMGIIGSFTPCSTLARFSLIICGRVGGRHAFDTWPRTRISRPTSERLHTRPLFQKISFHAAQHRIAFRRRFDDARWLLL